MTPKKVLIIDHDEVSCFIINRVFERHGCSEQLIFAKTAEDGLGLIEKENFDLILLELNISVSDGFQFLGKLNQLGKSKGITVPDTIILTVSIYPQDKAKAMEYPNVKAYVPKPFSDEHIDIIRSIVEKKINNI